MINIIYPGTFDPITNGHADLIKRASQLFDHVIVAVSSNKHKKPFISYPDRIKLAKKICTDMPNVSVAGFDGLLINFAQTQQCRMILRGLRAVTDFEYEFQLSATNRQLNSNIETIFLTPDEKVSYISSSLIKEIAILGGDVTKFVDPAVVAMLQKYLQNKGCL